MSSRASSSSVAAARATGSAIPNLLSSGNVPPPPYSPRTFMSPPTILSSPVYHPKVLSSPPAVPAAPPSTPHTPYDRPAAAATLGMQALRPPLFLGNVPGPPVHSLERRPSTPPPPGPGPGPSFVAASPPLNFRNPAPPGAPPVSPGAPPLAALDPHSEALLHQALDRATKRERSRIDALVRHESQNYKTVDEYRHALSRERRHAAGLAVELERLRFLARHASCRVHAAAEVGEEARINHLIKGIDGLRRDMQEDRVRVVMELEREEERRIMGLVARLDEVKREKALLERQIGEARGAVAVPGIGSGAGAMDGEERRLHARFESMMREKTGCSVPAGRQHDSSRREMETAAPLVGSEETMENDNKMEEDCEEGEEEEEDQGDGDIFEDMYHHDPEMEEELANLLKKKESKS